MFCVEGSLTQALPGYQTAQAPPTIATTLNSAETHSTVSHGSLLQQANPTAAIWQAHRSDHGHSLWRTLPQRLKTPPQDLGPAQYRRIVLTKTCAASQGQPDDVRCYERDWGVEIMHQATGAGERWGCSDLEMGSGRCGLGSGLWVCWATWSWGRCQPDDKRSGTFGDRSKTDSWTAGVQGPPPLQRYSGGRLASVRRRARSIASA